LDRVPPVLNLSFEDTHLDLQASPNGPRKLHGRNDTAFAGDDAIVATMNIARSCFQAVNRQMCFDDAIEILEPVSIVIGMKC
jgi:hypothetical protein